MARWRASKSKLLSVTEAGKVQFCERRPDCLLKAELLNREEREPPHEGSDEEVAESAENCDS